MILAGESPSMLKPDIHIINTHTDKTRLEESLIERDARPVFHTGVLKLRIKNSDAQRDKRLSLSTINTLT
jgi:hypothetical protein